MANRIYNTDTKNQLNKSLEEITDRIAILITAKNNVLLKRLRLADNEGR